MIFKAWKFCNQELLWNQHTVSVKLTQFTLQYGLSTIAYHIYIGIYDRILKNWQKLMSHLAYSINSPANSHTYTIRAPLHYQV